MTREQFDNLYKGKAVWCKTIALAKEFLALADSVKYVWASGTRLTKRTKWSICKQETVYFVGYNITYGSHFGAKLSKYAIVEFTGKGE